MKTISKVVLIAIILGAAFSMWPPAASAQIWLQGTGSWAGCYSEYWIMYYDKDMVIYWDCPEGGYGEACTKQSDGGTYCGVWVTY